MCRCPVPVGNASVKGRRLLETFHLKRHRGGEQAAVRQRDVQPSNVSLSANRSAGVEGGPTNGEQGQSSRAQRS